MRGTGVFTRDVFAQLGAMVVGHPHDMLPEMGFTSADGGDDGDLVAVALADAGTDGGWTHVYILNREQHTVMAGMLVEQLSDEQLDIIIAARAEKKEADASTLDAHIALPSALDTRTFGGKGGPSGDLAG